jgi:methylenetetrahydrofolate reductase (NADPH)
MHLKNKFDVGEFAVMVEMVPPKGIDLSKMVAVAEKLRGKVAAAVVPDMTAAVMRMSALGGAMILQSKGLDTVMQVCCRDRNRLAIQADLLAAYGCGITNVMVVKGEEITFGDHHQAKAVNDLTRQGFLEAVQKMAQGRDLAGAELAGAPQFYCGSAINVGLTGKELENEIFRMEREIEAGVQFFVTSPVFDVAAIAPFMEKVDVRKTNVIPTVMLFKSIGMARYIQRNMPHIEVPGALINRFQRAADKPHEAVLIAKETIENMKEHGFKGAMIQPMGWEEKLPEIVA